MKSNSLLPLCVAAAALLAASCNKQDITPSLPSSDLVEFRIGYALTTGAPLVKSGAEDLLAALAPTDALPLTLTNQSTGVQYSVNTGQTAMLPSGNYSVTYEPTKPSDAYTFNANVYFLDRPQLRVNTEVTLVKGTSEYTIPAEYSCSALLWSTREVEQFTMTAQLGTQYNPQFMVVGDIAAVFLHGQTDKPIPVAFQARNNYENVSFAINTTDPEDPYFMQTGFYYCVALPKPSQDVAFSFGPLEFQNGGIFTK